MTSSLPSPRKTPTALLPSRAVMFVLRAYKRFVSPMLPHSCRFLPTCSEYAIEAVERYGVLRGAWLAVQRLLRCHPFARSGVDVVPQATRSGASKGTV